MSYAKLLIDYPIEIGETYPKYVNRIRHLLLDYGITAKNTKDIADRLSRVNKHFITTEKTLKNGVLVSEKQKQYVEPEITDKSNYEATRVTTNPFSDGQWVRYEKRKQDYFELKDLLIADLEKYAYIYPKIEYPEHIDSNLLVIDPADIHIGKLCKAFETGDEYNNQIAVERVLSGVQGLISKCKGFNIDRILFIIGNDVLHVDTPKRTTTSGTPQDTDGMWYANFLIAKDVYVKCIELLLQIAPLSVHYNPSNHDYTNGFFLADTIKTWFKNTDIEFNCDISHRKYFRYYDNIIGTTHGDGARESDLPLLMAQESKDWSECKHRYFYIHHIHHKRSKDYGSVCVESLRSPSGTDSWHHRNGYQHSPKAVEAFIHSKMNGQIARITHIF